MHVKLFNADKINVQHNQAQEKGNFHEVECLLYPRVEGMERIPVICKWSHCFMQNYQI